MEKEGNWANKNEAMGKDQGKEEDTEGTEVQEEIEGGTQKKKEKKKATTTPMRKGGHDLLPPQLQGLFEAADTHCV